MAFPWIQQSGTLICICAICLLEVCGLKAVFRRIRVLRPWKNRSDTFQEVWRQHRLARPAWWCRPGKAFRAVRHGWGQYSSGSNSSGNSVQTFLELDGSGVAWVFETVRYVFPKQVFQYFLQRVVCFVLERGNLFVIYDHWAWQCRW